MAWNSVMDNPSGSEDLVRSLGYSSYCISVDYPSTQHFVRLVWEVVGPRWTIVEWIPSCLIRVYGTSLVKVAEAGFDNHNVVPLAFVSCLELASALGSKVPDEAAVISARLVVDLSLAFQLTVDVDAAVAQERATRSSVMGFWRTREGGWG